MSLFIHSKVVPVVWNSFIQNRGDGLPLRLAHGLSSGVDRGELVFEKTPKDVSAPVHDHVVRVIGCHERDWGSIWTCTHGCLAGPIVIGLVALIHGSSASLFTAAPPVVSCEGQVKVALVIQLVLLGQALRADGHREGRVNCLGVPFALEGSGVEWHLKLDIWAASKPETSLSLSNEGS